MTTILNHYDTLINPQSRIGDKYRSIFEIKQFKTQECKDLLIKAFTQIRESELLLHEVTYALGQLQPDEKTIEFLKQVIQDENEFPVVRHEAGEALSNYGYTSEIEFLRLFTDSQIEEVRETCKIGVIKLEKFKQHNNLYGQKYFGTIEPAAPFTIEELQQEIQIELDIPISKLYEKVREYILDENIQLYNKYRALYFLRDQNNNESIKLLESLIDPQLDFRKKTGVLLRHEVFFIFGQLGEKVQISVDAIKRVIEDETENGIVRHEAIGAYSGITDAKDILLKYSEDQNRIVKDSCLVALDMIDYWKSD